MWAKIKPSWARSVKIKRLNKLLGEPTGLAYLLTLWEWAMADGARKVDLYELEEQVGWDGPPGVLIESFQTIGFLDENRLGVWYEEAAGHWLVIQDKKKKEREQSVDRSQKHRDKIKAGKEAETPSRPNTVTNGNTAPSRHGGNTVTSRNSDRDVRGMRGEEKEEKRTNALGPSPNVQPLDPAAASKRGEWPDIKQAFLDEYEHRCNGHPPGGGKWGKGLFGDNGHFDVAAYLDKVAGFYPRIVRVAVPAFWPAWDQKQPKGRRGYYPSDMKGELEVYLMKRGLPSPGQRMMAGKI